MIVSNYFEGKVVVITARAPGYKHETNYCYRQVKEFRNMRGTIRKG